MLSMIVRGLVFFNGMYDLLCFVGIMWFHTLPGFSTFHLGVFRDEQDRRHPLVRRLLAYWILTYGSIRILAGAMDHESYAMDSAAALTYFIEIFGFEYELCCAGGGTTTTTGDNDDDDNNNNNNNHTSSSSSRVIQSKVTAITIMSLPIATLLLVVRPLCEWWW
jgi:hypothetical protein